MKFLVLSLLIVACSAVPTYNYHGNSGRSGQYSYGSHSYSSAPRVNLIGLSGGYSSGGYSGLNAGYSGLNAGYSGNYLSSGLLGGVSYAAPSVSYVLQPVSTAQVAYQAAPVSTIAIQAAPAVAQIAAAPVTSYATAARAAPAVSYAQTAAVQTAQHRSDNFQSVVPAAINQISRTVEYHATNNVEQPIQAQVVEVEPSDNPVHLHFKTRSSSLSVSQSHTPAEAGEVQSASAQDEPQRLITEVQKPVIQEVRETIIPYRQVTQEIHPVQESLHSVVHKGEARQQHYQQQNYAQNYAQNYGHQQASYVRPAQSAQLQAVSVAAPVQSYAVQAAPAIQTVAVAAPAVQSYAVAAPVQSAQIAYQVQPAQVQTIAVESAPVHSSYSVHSAHSAPVSHSAGYRAQYSSTPVASSYVHKQVSIEKPPIISSSHTSSSSSSNY